ncbi:hypothetical protein SAMN05443543_104125 [Flavobacterium flevense]|uniref:DUF4374 domain-containing protein n=1 Tax=Flavobacterium flevense TaxID=983 RepID=A0A4Y4B2P1_9FLAO|nr:hypothetical protein [Flavobacterium flevense]GEC73500.1 hypothetical protein FFL01_30390 [Flavobacterium flevense]SHL72707.1 hypothetical protein SAMN05443543_104125 [Flavobacterium flevense]
MKKNLFKIALFSIATALTLGSCSNDDNNDSGDNSGNDGTRWISLTGSFPDANGTAGNGGTRAYAITPENAENPDYEVDLFKMEGDKYVNGFALKSSRTARVQASADGKFLYNIQYTGTEGGVFNKYSVSGAGKYEEVGFELNTATILGTSPRWVKAAEGIGVGVSFGEALDPYTGTAPNFVYRNPKGTIKIANIDLNNTAITNTGSINIDLGTELESQGYHVWRADVPVLNQAKTKLFIGLGVRRHDINGTVTTNPTSGAINGWDRTDERNLGTLTYVIDYPNLRNAKIISSNNTMIDNLGYRTMTQYVGTDGHIYQATATSGPDILRIDKTTNEYDQAYHFNLNTALSITGASIKAWRYVKDGIAVVLYTMEDTAGGYVALINLNDKTAVKLTTEIEEDAELSTTLRQFQNIGVIGDNVYLPLTPAGKDGNIYIVNTKTKTIKKGAKLKTASGSYYIGAY